MIKFLNENVFEWERFQMEILIISKFGRSFGAIDFKIEWMTYWLTDFCEFSDEVTDFAFKLNNSREN